MYAVVLRVIFFTLFCSLLLKVGALPPNEAVGYALIAVQSTIVILAIVFIGLDLKKERKYIKRRMTEIKSDLAVRLSRKQKAEVTWGALRHIIRVQAKVRQFLARRRVEHLKQGLEPPKLGAAAWMKQASDPEEVKLDAAFEPEEVKLDAVEMVALPSAPSATGSQSKFLPAKQPTATEAFELGRPRSGDWQDRGIRGVPKRNPSSTTTPLPFRMSYHDVTKEESKDPEISR